MGLTEIIVLAVIALLVIGPKQLPEVARNLARFINELKRTTQDLKQSLHSVDPGVHEAVKEVTTVVKDTEQWVKNTTSQIMEVEGPNKEFGHIEPSTPQETIDEEHEGHAKTTNKKDS